MDLAQCTAMRELILQVLEERAAADGSVLLAELVAARLILWVGDRGDRAPVRQDIGRRPADLLG